MPVNSTVTVTVVMHAVCCSEWPCCSPVVQFPVRELGQFSEGQCTLTPVTDAMGLQMTGCKEAPTHSAHNLTTAMKKSHSGFIYAEFNLSWNVV